MKLCLRYSLNLFSMRVIFQVFEMLLEEQVKRNKQQLQLSLTLATREEMDTLAWKSLSYEQLVLGKGEGDVREGDIIITPFGRAAMLGLTEFIDAAMQWLRVTDENCVTQDVTNFLPATISENSCKKGKPSRHGTVGCQNSYSECVSWATFSPHYRETTCEK